MEKYLDMRMRREVICMNLLPKIIVMKVYFCTRSDQWTRLVQNVMI